VGGLPPAQPPVPADEGRTVINMARTRKTLSIRLAPEPTRSIPSQEEVLGRNFAAAFHRHSARHRSGLRTKEARPRACRGVLDLAGPHGD